MSASKQLGQSLRVSEFGTYSGCLLKDTSGPSFFGFGGCDCILALETAFGSNSLYEYLVVSFLTAS